ASARGGQRRAAAPGPSALLAQRSPRLRLKAKLTARGAGRVHAKLHRLGLPGKLLRRKLELLPALAIAVPVLADDLGADSHLELDVRAMLFALEEIGQPAMSTDLRADRHGVEAQAQRAVARRVRPDAAARVIALVFDHGGS